MSVRGHRVARITLIVLLMVGLSAFLGRTRPSTYDDAWRALPLATAPADSLRAADGREVALEGYVVPLGVGQAERFLLTPAAPGCPFCRPGLATAVEVVADAPPPAGDGPIVVRGTLSFRPDSEPMIALLDATARPAPSL
ncbi:MAG: hypothetical protein AAGK21_10670 [Bacteroidota bacterium]